MEEKDKAHFLIVTINNKKLHKVHCTCCNKYIDISGDETKYQSKINDYLMFIRNNAKNKTQKYIEKVKNMYKHVYYNGVEIELKKDLHCKECNTNHLLFTNHDSSSFIKVYNALHINNNDDYIQVISYEKSYELQISDKNVFEREPYLIDYYKSINSKGEKHRVFNESFEFLDKRIELGEKHNIENIIRYARVIPKSSMRVLFNFNKKTKQINVQNGKERFNLSYSVIHYYRYLSYHMYWLFYNELLKYFDVRVTEEYLMNSIISLCNKNIYIKENKGTDFIDLIRKLVNDNYTVLNPSVEIRYIPRHIRSKLKDVNSNYQALKLMFPGLTKEMMKHSEVFYVPKYDDLMNTVGIDNLQSEDDYFHNESFTDLKANTNLIQFIIYAVENKNVVSNFLSILNTVNYKAVANSSERNLKKIKNVVYKYFPRFENMIYHITKKYKNSKDVYEISGELYRLSEFIYIILKTERHYQNYLNGIHSYSEETSRSIDEKIKEIFTKKMNYYSLHDNLTILNFYFTNILNEYKYNEHELKYNEVLNGIEFSLPENNYILNDIGLKMKHCVGTYDTLVKNKRALIIYLKRNEEYILCLEIRNNQLIQAKKKYNLLLDEVDIDDKEVKNTLLKYLKKHKIDTSICRDI